MRVQPYKRANFLTCLTETITVEAHDLVMCVDIHMYTCTCLPTLVDVVFQSAYVDADSCQLPHARLNKKEAAPTLLKYLYMSVDVCL